MMLEVNDIHVLYGRLTAVRGISITIARREIVCIVGPNGAGKSTTLLAIAGALRPALGTIRLNGRSITGLSPEVIARQGVSLIPEGRHIFHTLTIEENLRLGTGMRQDKAQIGKDLDLVLESFPVLRERFRSPAGTLSGGEQQQLAIGRALLTNPSLILIDEPSLGLAPQIVDRVYDILIQLRNGNDLTLLIVEQSAERAIKIADRIYVMRSGEVTLSGRAADLAHDAQMEAAYFGVEKSQDASFRGIGP